MVPVAAERAWTSKPPVEPVFTGTMTVFEAVTKGEP
jgi:hypothetical protein